MSDTPQSNNGKHIKDVLDKIKLDLSALGKNVDTISGAVNRHETDLLNIKSQKNVSESLKENHVKFTSSYNTNMEEVSNKFADINNRIDSMSRDLSNVNNTLKKIESDGKDRQYKLENDLNNKLDKAVTDMESKLNSVVKQFYV